MLSLTYANTHTFWQNINMFFLVWFSSSAGWNEMLQGNQRIEENVPTC